MEMGLNKSITLHHKKSQFLAGQITDSVMDILFLFIFNQINLPKTLQL